MKEENELEKMNNFVKEFYEKFGKVDVSQLTGQLKKDFLKAKEMVEKTELQIKMGENILDTFSRFGVNSIKMGSKTYSTQNVPDDKPDNKPDNNFDDLV